MYAYALEITPATTGTVNVKVTGRSVNKTEYVVSDPVENARATSQWATFENLLVTNSAQARQIAAWCKAYLSLRTTYTMDYSGRPEIDTFDHIRMQSQFSEALPVWVIQRSLTFNGALRGGLILKRSDE